MDARTLPSVAGAPTAVPPASVPITAPAFRRLGEQAARLAGDLHAAEMGAHHAGGGDEAPPPPPGEVQVLARRLDALKRVVEAAEVVEPDGRAVLGTRVTVRFADGDVEVFELVAPCEVDTESGRVSHESPLGAAVLGRRAGDAVSLLAPAGLQLVTVLEVAPA
jgi:transcription elongation GreA/GreB family factor